MKPARFHFIRTPSFVRGWNGGPSPQISPTSGHKFISVPKSPPTPLYSPLATPHLCGHGSHTRQQPLGIHAPLSQCTHTHTHTLTCTQQQAANTVKPQIECAFITINSHAILFVLFIYLSAYSLSPVIPARASYINPKALLTATTCQNFQR